jgi:hypothetical protein
MTEENSILDVSVPLRLYGKNLVIRYRGLAFMRYLKEFKRDIFTDLSRLDVEGSALRNLGSGNLTQTPSGAGLGSLFELVRDLLWAGLLEVQPAMTLEDVTNLLDMRSLMPVLPAIAAAVQAGMPQGEPSHPPKPQVNVDEEKSLSTTGPSSGPSSETPAVLQPVNSAA